MKMTTPERIALLESAIHTVLITTPEGRKLIDRIEQKLTEHEVARVTYTATGRKPGSLQPKVKQVFQALAKRPLTMPELEQRLPKVDRNTLRFAVQVLRQAGLVVSKR